MALRCLRDTLRRGKSLASLAPSVGYVAAARLPVDVTGEGQVQEALTKNSRCLLFGGFSPMGSKPGSRDFHSSHFPQDSVTIAVPSMGDSVADGSIQSILKQPGDHVSEDEVVAQIDTDKVTIDVRYTGTTPGIIKEIMVKVEDKVTVGQPICMVEETEGDVPIEQPSEGHVEQPSSPPPQPQAPPPQTPQQKGSEPAAAPAPAGHGAKAPDASNLPQMRPENRVKMTRLRKRVAERLKGAQNTYAMLSTFNEIDMTNIMEMRTIYKDMFLEKHGVKLGFMSAFVKASVVALHDIPAVNGVIEEDEIVYREYIDISLAVATPKGLVVPVLRNASQMNFAEVEKAIVNMGAKARDGTLSIDEMAGGTFTISNGGVYGSLLSTPIINPPQSAILGMHSIQKRPMVVGKEILPRPMMYVALTYDHRLIDGREAVTFLRRIKDLIEDPRRFLIDV